MSKYQVRIIRASTDHEAFVRSLRLIAKLEIKQAHDLAQYIDRRQDIVILAGVDSTVAAHITETLRDAGAEVVTEISSIEDPMLCTPEANVIYEWGAMRTIRPRRAGTAGHIHSD